MQQIQNKKNSIEFLVFVWPIGPGCKDLTKCTLLIQSFRDT